MSLFRATAYISVGTVHDGFKKVEDHGFELESRWESGLVPREGFEPPTYCLEGSCSGPLS